jgi:hypothetical protein
MKRDNLAMKVELRAAQRLLADESLKYRKSKPQEKTVAELKSAMSIMLGKGMRIDENSEGQKMLVSFSGSNAADMSAHDMGRIQRAMLDAKALLTVHVDQGKLVFTFEIEE